MEYVSQTIYTVKLNISPYQKSRTCLNQNSFSHNLNFTDAEKAALADSRHATAPSAYVDTALTLAAGRKKIFFATL